MNDQVQYQIIAKNLERKFNALLEHSDEEKFMMLHMDYVIYLGKQRLLSPIFDELLESENLYECTVEHLFFAYLITGLEKYGRPSFITKKIQKKFKIVQKLKKELDQFREEDKQRKKDGLPFFDPKKDFLPSRKEDLYVIQKLHNHLLEKLSEITLIKSDITLDRDGYLHFNGVKILISKSMDSDPYHILTTLFKRKSKIWSYDEIWEDWHNNENFDAKNWRKFYNASYKINAKVAQETMVKDFLIFNSKTVRINNHYL
ncbi:MAG: hypothetical protein COU69_04670 [Candidatus Pacebacteria bacterium CG10_big_fil_rev_8_21_14_0_10_56_10]|nr:MAG: hypothetical protein COU69_04670 [Candidatus Pacebacteria bacterium CG10_big_fil_rev_8_21_14_0_10_56_10]